MPTVSGALRALFVCVLLVQACSAVGAAGVVDAAGAVGAANAPAATPPANEASTTSSARIVGVYPNPVAREDVGEFVVVRVDGAANLTLSDGEDTFSLPTASGRVVLSSDPAATRNATTLPVFRADLSLSNAGERLVLARNGTVVHDVRYEDAPEGERLNVSTGRWTPLGLRLREAVATGPADATAFVLPDAPGVPVETLRSADDRLLLAGYTFSSDRVADALVAAHRRGVRVRVLVEGSPVGGASTRQAEMLDRLVDEGIPVAVVAGPRARFSYHHAKYAVADDSAVVLTENWKPSGTGGRDSRGWGVRVDSARTADELASMFAADASGRGVVRWESYRTGREFVADAPPDATYPERFAPESVRATEVRVLTTPGNAGEEVIRRVDGAEERIAVVTPRIDPDGRFFAALVRAAERGVEVHLLLSNAWYDEESNRAVVARARELNESGLPIRSRIARPSGDFGKVHAKGAVVDGEYAVVGSLNWNDHAATENREVVLELAGEEPAAYYLRVFDADWRAAGGEGREETPWLLVAGALASATLAGVVLKKVVRFEG
ncbi:phospholipase D-like domain-containing protein [Halogeometricum limi]|uniref:Phosphatidylserine/phosphatidylglycerophosphate/cardiolipin synthase n=1 Tax=Halogeometricum limi TaxID=555875 RepID=A0A1I6GTN2_9EURY|nr:phospholipase D-like domain-containing protein [Halogeometricum limi]SFR45595.1 Phosphatidylserine/phosphatidylglycerophosphate/cardiolipin synthase [Halogeometricum limi]